MPFDNPDDVRKFYQEKFKEHGATPEGMAYRSEKSHDDRLMTAMSLIEWPMQPCTILDVGCGIGLLAEYWISLGAKFGTYYYGIDLVPEYVEEANKRLPEKSGAFVGNFLEWDFGEDTFDYVFVLGTLAWLPLTQALELLDKAWKLTKHTLVFTALIDRPLAWSILSNVHRHFHTDHMTIKMGYIPGEAMIVLSRGETNDDAGKG